MLGISAGRLTAFLLAGWSGLIFCAALSSLVTTTHAWYAVLPPNLAFLVLLYFGLYSRANIAGVCVLAVALGYLADLLVGAPKGTYELGYLTLGLVIGASERLLLRGALVTMVVAAAYSAALGAFIVCLRNLPTATVGFGALRRVPFEALATALVAPLVFRWLRRLDRLFVRDTRALPGGLTVMEKLRLGGLSVPRGGLGSDVRSAMRSYQVVAALATLVFVALAGRLWQLQVVRGESYYKKTAENFVKEADLPATRGEIRDRNGKILVENRASYNVYVTPRFFTDAALARLTKDLHLTDEQAAQIKAKAAARKGLERLQQFLAADDITRDQMALVESDKQELPGVSVGSRPYRAYPHGKVGAHVLGFMNQVNGDELLTLRDKGYRPGDYIGRAGLERQFEDYLRGKDGFARIVVDAKGHTKTDVDPGVIATIVGGPMEKKPEAGDNVFLTLDLDLQRVVEKALARFPSAAAAVIDVNTGRVLAMASHPSFNPNVLTGHLTRAEAQRLETDPFRPLVDKAVHEIYFPGSTFKIIAALAALEDKQVTPEEKMVCSGAYKLPGHTFHCMEVHKRINLYSALVESCNIFFHHLGERLGLDRMALLAEQFGFGELTGIGLPGESAGFIPTTDWYKKHGGFRIGYTLNTAIGQGETKVTVLQLAAAYAALATNGKLYTPTLVDRIETPSGQLVEAFPPRLKRVVPGTPESYEYVRRALCGVVNDPKGTGWVSHDPDLPGEVCGKTGTAQVRSQRRGDTSAWDANNAHSWFAAFGPADSPQIAVAVLVEHGGLGGHVAAPIAMDIFRAWFKRSYATPTDAKAPVDPALPASTVTR